MRSQKIISKLFVTVATAAFLAGCSDSLERLTKSFPGSNPSDADPVYTASVPKAKRVITGPLEDDEITSSPIQTSKLSTMKQAKRPVLVMQPEEDVSEPVLDSTDVAAADEPIQAPVRTVRKQVKVSQSNGKVRVAPGMTMYSIATANDISVRELARANGIKAPYRIAVGQTLRIPGEGAAVTPSIADATPVTKSTRKSRAGGSYTVESGDTLYALSRKFGVSPFVIADANGLKKNATLALGQRLTIPGAKVAKAPELKEVERLPETKTTSADPIEVNPTTIDEPTTKPDVQVGMDEPTTKPPVKQHVEQPTTAALAMRWPVKGRVISGFGPKPNGLKNEGINISLPEGMDIRAAENGVVAYAGNELKGYGNLILIRHEGGYVTAYAHAQSLSVKRGDTVKRGQTIATVGQTGAVTQPQLHFEVRKGATALDPMKFLDSATAQN